MNCIPQYYKNRVCLNVLAGSIKNAKEVYDACDGYVLIGVLSKNYSTVEAAIEDMKKYSKEIDNAICGAWSWRPKSVKYGISDF